MIVKFSFGYWVSEITEEEFARVQTLNIKELPETKEELAKRSWMEFKCDFRALRKALPGRCVDVKFADDGCALDGILERLERIESKLTTCSTRVDGEIVESQQFNAKCHVHVPNLGLLLIDETEVVADFCTEKLQDKLNDGWRILAICPQPDQRRPDYVLGRVRK